MTQAHSSGRGRLTLIALAVIIIAGGIGYSVLHKKPVKTAEAPIPVSIQAARKVDLPVWLDAIGTVQPLHTVMVKVRVDGELQKVAFTEGQDVHEGDLLAQIDPRPYETQLLQAQAAKARDEAQIASTQVDLKRATGLANAGAGPTQNVDTLSAQAAALKATLQADDAAIQNAKLQLDYTRIRAPFSGRTGQRNVDPGAIVHASDTAGLVTLTQLHPISVAFTLPQDNLSEIQQEMQQHPLTVQAMSRDGSQPLATGTLSFVDNQVTAATGKVQFKATFTNADQKLWPGALVTARLLLRTQTGAVVVPASAVQQNTQGNFVYLVQADNTVTPRPITTGLVVGDQQWVRKGLEAGERVVTQGQYRVAPGLKVVGQVASSAATASAAGAQ